MKSLLCVLVINMFLTSFPTSVLSQTFKSGESGVKLCDREFIKAVVFTCGALRWKRLLDNQNDPFQTSSDKDYFKEMDNDRNQQLEPSFAEQVFDDYYNQYEQIPDDFSEYIRQIEGGSNKDRAFASSLMQHLPWARSFRMKRDGSAEMLRRCCTSGCTKKDISTFC
ncbi:relaxin-3-like [Heptranchias perlo]|uniref:relaxin-3-like n=1 Tax=Heptranchias perlo TaxID=212740 RepID=UPI00355944A8